MKYTGLIEVMIESDRGRKKSASKKQTFRRVSGGRGRLNYHWVGFHWVCYKGVYFQ